MNTRLDRRLTARDLDDLPHEWDTVYELIGGVLYMAKRPSNHHQVVLLNICIALKGPVRAIGGTVVPEPGLLWEDDGEDNVSPDVAIVLARLDLREKKLRQCPDIAAEILSPGAENVRRDLEAKRDLYWRRGGREYWIVDLEEQTILRLTRGERAWQEERLSRADTIRTPLLPGWDGVPVADFFAEEDGLASRLPPHRNGEPHEIGGIDPELGCKRCPMRIDRARALHELLRDLLARQAMPEVMQDPALDCRELRECRRKFFCGPGVFVRVVATACQRCLECKGSIRSRVVLFRRSRTRQSPQLPRR